MSADPATFPHEYLLKTFTAMEQVMLSRGLDTAYGRKLPAALRAAGLSDVEAEGQLTLITGGSAGAMLLRANFEQMRDPILGTGITAEEFAQDLRRLDDAAFSCPSPVMWTVRGRRR